MSTRFDIPLFVFVDALRLAFETGDTAATKRLMDDFWICDRYVLLKRGA